MIYLYAEIGGKCAFNVYLFPKKMKRPQRKEDGTYHINGKKFRELFGSRQQVMNGTAYKTAGELVKSDLMMNKWGRIVSRKKHASAKKEKRLLKSGYTAKKGKFGYVKVGTKKNRKTRKMRGGNDDDDDNTPPPVDNTSTPVDNTSTPGVKPNQGGKSKKRRGGSNKLFTM